MGKYNEDNFEGELIGRLNEDLDNIIKYQTRLSLLLKNFLRSASEDNIAEVYKPLLNLIEKIILNFKAVNLITPLLKEDYRFKTSTNLLYRAIIDDNINILYLVAFKEEDETAFKNELLILERDYINGVLKILEAQEKINNYFNRILNNEDFPNLDLEEAKQIIKSENSTIFEKNNKEIRGVFSKDFTENFEEAKLNVGGRLISAEKKIKFIELRKSPHADILKSLNKYYTQFFHFSPKGSDLILNDIEFDLKCYYLSIIQVVDTLKIMVKAFKLSDTCDNEINDYVNFIASSNSSK